MTHEPDGHEFHVKAEEDRVHVEIYKDGELVVRGHVEGLKGLSQMEKLYDMWSSVVWSELHEDK